MELRSPAFIMGLIDILGGIDEVTQYIEGKLFFRARADKKDFKALYDPRSTENKYNSLGDLYRFFEEELRIFERTDSSKRPQYTKLDGAAEKLEEWYNKQKNNGHKGYKAGHQKNKEVYRGKAAGAA